MSHGVILGVAVGAVCVVFLLYRAHASFTNWMLVGAGAALAGLAARYVGPYLAVTTDGLSIAGIATIVILALFYCEVIKGYDLPFSVPLVKPAVSLMAGLALVLTLGTAGQMLMPAAHHQPATTSVVRHG